MHGGMKLRPWEIDEMTIPEIEMALDEDLEKPMGGSLSLEEQRQYAEERRAMTWEQKIAEARG